MSENARLETFCDGVFAIAITLLIIEVKIPATTHVETAADLWRALAALLPTIFAFLLSFAIILITWVNHHETFKLIDGSSPRFIYANGFLLMTIAFVPFPTALLGESLLTEHAAPAVVLYSAVDALMAVGWWLFGRTALTKNAHGAARMRGISREAVFAFVFYSACAVAAVWWPRTMAAIISLVWCVWLVKSLTARAEAQPRAADLPSTASSTSSTMVTS